MILRLFSHVFCLSRIRFFYLVLTSLFYQVYLFQEVLDTHAKHQRSAYDNSDKNRYNNRNGCGDKVSWVLKYSTSLLIFWNH